MKEIKIVRWVEGPENDKVKAHHQLLEYYRELEAYGLGGGGESLRTKGYPLTVKTKKKKH